ncbi:hypothetical protein [Methanolobus sp. ZRKC5]|uniref:hypothetical protein n=1 Tax=unclassified Methanolobus TaxID=2629569 RepID=UPI00313EC68D
MATRYIKKVGVLSLGKILAVLYAIMGLILGAFMTLASLTIGAMSYHAGMGGMFFGAGAIIILPIFYGILGFITGIITALIFNVATGFIGGLEIEVE